MKKTLKFWGTRGSCAVSGPQYKHFGGNTVCLELNYKETTIIFDAGTGIRPLGEVLKERKIKNIDLFLSHTHWDHLIGFPFFDPLYDPDCTIHIWSPANDCRELFNRLLSPEFFPIDLHGMKAKLIFKTIHAHQPVTIGSVKIDFVKANHPGHTFGFKIETPNQTIGYVTDNEITKIDPKFIDFYKNCEIFIHEAQYSPEEYSKKHGWGHSCLANTVKMVEAIDPGQFLVTHHDPAHTDDHLIKLSNLAKNSLSCVVDWIPDGHVIELK